MMLHSKLCESGTTRAIHSCTPMTTRLPKHHSSSSESLISMLNTASSDLTHQPVHTKQVSKLIIIGNSRQHMQISHASHACVQTFSHLTPYNSPECHNCRSLCLHQRRSFTQSLKTPGWPLDSSSNQTATSSIHLGYWEEGPELCYISGTSYKGTCHGCGMRLMHRFSSNAGLACVVERR